MTYPEAYTKLADMRAHLSSSFGYPGEPGYKAYYRTPDGARYILSNGGWSDGGKVWMIEPAP